MEELFFTFISENISAAAKSSLMEKLVVFGIIWFFVKKTFKNHLQNIQDNLENLVDSVKSLENAIVRLETNHTQRLNELEKEVIDIKNNIKKE